MLTPGLYTATIKSNSIGSAQSGTPFVKLLCAVGEDEVDVFVYLSDKAMGMARAALKKCGFDPDKQELVQLQENAGLLSGNEIRIEYQDDGHFGPRGQVVLSDVNDKQLAELTAKLRSVKKKDIPASDNDEGLPF